MSFRPEPSDVSAHRDSHSRSVEPESGYRQTIEALVVGNLPTKEGEDVKKPSPLSSARIFRTVAELRDSALNFDNL